ncbi:hypothetical protein LAUMK136_04738 [Mycobacterium attenuatum]|uniref:Uncharacterized protein n=1 Tax=Mycobacterium attenuatum TaxID=2341086 RepID=A0A498QE30_9MYCO|nr:hypothetical protein LAUMK136_04738 [Mycobacterium attenuatum]
MGRTSRPAGPAGTGRQRSSCVRGVPRGEQLLPVLRLHALLPESAAPRRQQLPARHRLRGDPRDLRRRRGIAVATLPAPRPGRGFAPHPHRLRDRERAWAVRPVSRTGLLHRRCQLGADRRIVLEGHRAQQGTSHLALHSGRRWHARLHRSARLVCCRGVFVRHVVQVHRTRRAGVAGGCRSDEYRRREGWLPLPSASAGLPTQPLRASQPSVAPLCHRRRPDA